MSTSAPVVRSRVCLAGCQRRTHPSQKADDLIWLIETVQAVTDTPLSLDTANNMLQAAVCHFSDYRLAD